jgi:glycogen debranching enzyme
VERREATVRQVVVGRVGPVELAGAPYVPAEAREELLVLKEGALFLCARPDGEVVPAQVTGEGLFVEDTRHLSELRLTLGSASPVLLASSADLVNVATVHATNPDLWVDGHIAFPQQTIHVERTFELGDRLAVRVELRNFGRDRLSSSLELTLGADFADMFEVRGARRRESRGVALAPVTRPGGVVLSYRGEDGAVVGTAVEWDHEPQGCEPQALGLVVAWPVDLGPGESVTYTTWVEPERIGADRHPRRPGRAREARRGWEESCASFHSDDARVDRVLRRSVRDLQALTTPLPTAAGEGDYVAAGIPWYVALFGRDPLITSGAALMLTPELARRSLLVLARFQATHDDPARDAEPGKILHEWRSGELARAGLIPHAPYYGTVDATPLFLMLAGAYYRWTADLETLSELRPALDAALRWMDEHGDRDGDGFLEYERRAPGGLRNQGWKDSEDSTVHADGSLAEGPIALVEVQGYAYLARIRAAEIYEALGEPDRARELLKKAAELRAAFHEAFWMPEEGTFALALDGAKRQVGGVASNPGHCLLTGIVDPAEAAQVAERLLAPDMWSGWGVRTLSSDSPAYNPMSYHNGSIWPHDNAIVAAGLKRYGFVAEAERIATALFEVAGGSTDGRLPELYCGFDRGTAPAPVPYPVACVPQGWAAAAPILLLQSMLGISARAPEGTLVVAEPRLPEWLGGVELRGVRVGAGRASLRFTRDESATAFSLMERAEGVRVVMRG